ncbi:hypothetical protein H5410_011986 [Solanum commersonii]|uniref:Uncharacterized protein n=1 Tax=Solanum commersonii TaxID=4109 RepID=A0A9J6AQ41_SOLCO|nr:hypothetical protein H5410_011986 [Solanum commersonii]
MNKSILVQLQNTKNKKILQILSTSANGLEQPKICETKGKGGKRKREAAFVVLVVWYTKGDEVHRRQRGIFWPSGTPEKMESIWGSLMIRRSRRWYGKRKTVERGTRLVRRLMVFGFVEVREGRGKKNGESVR